MPRLGTPTGTIEVLHKYNFNFQKKFGQNFLIEPGVLETIVEAAEIGEEDCVLEIGPGIGTMTQYLAEQAGEVIAVEIDKALIPILKDTLSAYQCYGYQRRYPEAGCGRACKGKERRKAG